MNLAKTKLIDTIGRYNLKVNNVSKFKFNDAEIEMFCNMMNEYAAEVNGVEKSDSNCDLDIVSVNAVTVCPECKTTDNRKCKDGRWCNKCNKHF